LCKSSPYGIFPNNFLLKMAILVAIMASLEKVCQRF
jgi:hypothetical protein